VNQVELFFSILQIQCLRDGSFSWVKELRAALLDFIAFWNREQAHPGARQECEMRSSHQAAR
jgi:hypothetical protein